MFHFFHNWITDKQHPDYIFQKCKKCGKKRSFPKEVFYCFHCKEESVGTYCTHCDFTPWGFSTDWMGNVGKPYRRRPAKLPPPPPHKRK